MTNYRCVGSLPRADPTQRAQNCRFSQLILDLRRYFGVALKEKYSPILQMEFHLQGLDL